MHALVLCGGGSVDLLPSLRKQQARNGTFATTLTYNKESTFNPGMRAHLPLRPLPPIHVFCKRITYVYICLASTSQAPDAAFVVAGRLKRRAKWWGGHFIQPNSAIPPAGRGHSGSADAPSDRDRDRALGGLLAALVALFVALKAGLV